MDDQQFIARETWKSVPATEIQPLVEKLLCTYLADRTEGESFAAFSRRHTPEELVSKVS